MRYRSSHRSARARNRRIIAASPLRALISLARGVSCRINIVSPASRRHLHRTPAARSGIHRSNISLSLIIIDAHRRSASSLIIVSAAAARRARSRRIVTLINLAYRVAAAPRVSRSLIIQRSPLHLHRALGIALRHHLRSRHRGISLAQLAYQRRTRHLSALICVSSRCRARRCGIISRS